MIVKRILCLFVLVGLGLGIPNTGFAQETLTSDGDLMLQGWGHLGNDNQNRSRIPVQLDQPSAAARITANAPFPFFDDFSDDSYTLDTNLWEASAFDDFLPTLSYQRARNAPSKGVMTLDGATQSKKKHSVFFETNYADFIESKPFDLSGLGPSDNLILSFYYQAGGWGDAPESFDSLIISYDTSGTGDYVQQWAVAGNGVASDTFQLVELFLGDTAFFHDAFRFRIENYGSMNGEVDLWHVDYVYFAQNRTVGDDGYQDVSPTRIVRSPLGEYTAMPFHFYNNGGFSDSIGVEISNVGGPATSASASLTLSDPTGSNTLTNTTTLSSGSQALNPYANNIVSAGTFSDQGANFNGNGALRVSVKTTNSGDTRPGNDDFAVDFRVDSVLAYDDGQPDAGYGLTYARAFCQEFRIPEPDTISAVWIAFAPTLNFNPVISQSTCMDGESFKLTLWDTLAPDSFTTQQGSGMVIEYDSADNYFQRFTFINPQVVDTVFWLGLRQNTNKPLGVGFDKNGMPGKLYYEGQNGQFIPSTLDGVVMIRPEFANLTEPSVNLDQAQSGNTVQGYFYPNPTAGDHLGLRLEGEGAKSGRIKLYDTQGRIAFESHLKGTGRNFDFNLPSSLSAGIYMVDFQGVDLKGKQIGLFSRLIVQK